MIFLKPNRLILSIFGLPFLLLTGFLLGNFVGNFSVPLFLGVFTTIFYLFSIAPLFRIFESLGIDMGKTSDYFGIPDLSFFGWVIILFVWAIIYYLIASAISRLITDDKKRSVVFYVLSLIEIIYVCLVVFYSVASAKNEQPTIEMIKQEQECWAQSEPSEKACITACEPFLGPISDGKTLSPEAYRACTNNCSVSKKSFIKECAMQDRFK